MKSLKLNNEGDLEFDTLHRLKLVEDTDEVVQRLKLSIETEMKEWFLDTNFGIPWLPNLEKGAPKEEYRKEVLQVLNDDPAVTKVNSVNVTFDRGQRKLSIDFVAEIGDEAITESVVIE